MERNSQLQTPQVIQIVAYLADQQEITYRFNPSTTPISIGRGPRNRIQVLNQSVSVNHVEIFSTNDGGYLVNDIDSTNGTYLNGRLINIETLLSGDSIRLGGEVYLHFSLIPGEQIEEFCFDELIGLSR